MVTAAMFADLTDSERRELANRLGRASLRFLNEYDLLKNAPPSVLATYGAIPSDWLMCCVEAGRLKVELAPPAPVVTLTGTGWPL